MLCSARPRPCRMPLRFTPTHREEQLAFSQPACCVSLGQHPRRGQCASGRRCSTVARVGRQPGGGGRSLTETSRAEHGGWSRLRAGTSHIFNAAPQSKLIQLACLHPWLIGQQRSSAGGRDSLQDPCRGSLAFLRPTQACSGSHHPVPAMQIASQPCRWPPAASAAAAATHLPPFLPAALACTGTACCLTTRQAQRWARSS